MRKELAQFATRMEFTLQENDNKPHWSGSTQNYLHHALNRKNEKLQGAVCDNNHGQVIRHAVDLANYAMMLADNAINKMERKQQEEPIDHA